MEHYDGIKDPIKKYFMEKIQITLLSNHTKKSPIRDKVIKNRDDSSLSPTRLLKLKQDSSKKNSGPNNLKEERRSNPIRAKKATLQEQREKRSRHWKF